MEELVKVLKIFFGGIFALLGFGNIYLSSFINYNYSVFNKIYPDIWVNVPSIIQGVGVTCLLWWAGGVLIYWGGISQWAN